MRHILTAYPGVLVLVLAVALFGPIAHAERYGLLVGVGKYHTQPLSGPQYDVQVMQKVLLQQWGFKKKNLTVLLDQQGTKKNILAEIGKLYKKSKPGDQVFIYLSGHGTSSQDKDISAPLPTTSGAFIPIDVKGVKTVAQLVERLIIGRKDLRPLLMKLDRGGRHVFVVIDACYSGNTVRGVYNKKQLPTRFMNLRDLLPKRAFGDDLVSSDADWGVAAANEDSVYPYKNVYYLAASGEYEPAQDIPPELIDAYPTIDGKPHGAFSDTLLRVLTKNIDADIDQDGSITYAELKKTVRDAMRTRGFNHTPQGLPSLAEDRGNLASRGIFSGADQVSAAQNSQPVAVAHVKAPKKPDNPVQPHDPIQTGMTGKSGALILRVKLDRSLRGLRNKLNQLREVQLVDDRAALELRRSGSDVLFISNAGDLVTRLVRPDDKKIVDYVNYQAWIYRLVHRPYQQDFNVDVEMYKAGRGSTAREGELVGFSIRSSETAYILLLDIDPQGTVTVIYPYTQAELQAVPAGQVLALKDISRVRPPFGRDYIQVYAFKDLHDDLRALRAQSFAIGSPMVKYLERLIANHSLLKARSNLELVTVRAE